MKSGARYLKMFVLYFFGECNDGIKQEDIINEFTGRKDGKKHGETHD